MPVRHDPRRDGRSGYTYGALATHALNVLTGFTTRPLRVVSLIGLATMVFGAGVLMYVLGLLRREPWRRTGFSLPRLDRHDLRRCAAPQSRNNRRVHRAHAHETHGPTAVHRPRRGGRSHGSTALAAGVDDRERAELRTLAASGGWALMAYRIPFNRVSVVGSELTYVSQALEQGHISGDGPFSERCEEHSPALVLGAPRVPY